MAKSPRPRKKKITKAEQAKMVAEYDTLLTKAKDQYSLDYEALEELLGVRYECISKRRHGKQTVTHEAILALRMVLVDHEHSPASEINLEDMLS